MATPAAAIKPILTVEEYLGLPSSEIENTELVDGVIVRLAGAKLRHEAVKSFLFTELSLYGRETGAWMAFAESMYQLDARNARVPDVSLLSMARYRGANRDLILQGAPEVAMEIVSGETAADLEAKVRAYLQGGSRQVWVVYPNTQTVYAFGVNGAVRRLEAGGVLDEPGILPGFAVPVARVFE